MITETEKEALLSKISEHINSALKSVSVGEIIWDKYRKANEKALDNVDVLNGFLRKLYSSLGLEHDFEEQIFLLDDNLNDKLAKILRKVRSGLEKTPTKPNRRLAYSIQIEDHNHCGVVLDKNIEIIEDIIAHHDSRGGEIGENLSQSLDDKIDSTVANSKKYTLDEVKGLPAEEIIMEYAKILSEDDSVTLEEWSEFLEEIIPSDRMSCCSSCWVSI